jgi:hypothetical protein
VLDGGVTLTLKTAVVAVDDKTVVPPGIPVPLTTDPTIGAVPFDVKEMLGEPPVVTPPVRVDSLTI